MLCFTTREGRENKEGFTITVLGVYKEVVSAITIIPSMKFEKMKNKIICGACLEVMKDIPNNSIDLVLTDPPYNAKDIGPNKRVYSKGTMQLPLKEYKAFCRAWFREAKRISKNIVFTSGISNVCFYPQPYWIICWHKPAAVSFNRMGGFNAWEPILIYGKTKAKIGQDYILFNTLNFKKGTEAYHPCPKPLELWKWLVEKFSNENDLILDPLLGSGTTAVAAKHLKRNFIGIEINPDYCKIARDRLRQEILI